MKPDRRDSYDRLNTFGKAVTWSVVCTIAFICDILLSVIATLPFSLFTRDWSYWIYGTVTLVVLQIIVTGLILIGGIRRGGK